MSDHRYRSIISRHINVTRLFIHRCHPCKFPVIIKALWGQTLLDNTTEVQIYMALQPSRVFYQNQAYPPDLSGSFDKYFVTSSTIVSLTHWGRVTHICVGRLTIIGSDNGLSPGRCQAIIWTNAGILLIGPLGTNFSEILIEIQTFSLKKIRLKMSSAKCCSFRLGLNVLNLNAWMLPCPFQYKSPGSFENFDFKFSGASTKYILNVSAFRFFGIDLKLILSGSTYFNSSHMLRGLCLHSLFMFEKCSHLLFPISDVIIGNDLKLILSGSTDF